LGADSHASLSVVLALPIGNAAAGELAAAREDVLASSRLYWADGYVWASHPTAASYTPITFYSFNRTGGAIEIAKPAGTIGRYVVKFTGLSDFLGARSTVHVTGYVADDTYCWPLTATLVRDNVQVRCISASTGAAANADFTVLVTRNYTDLAFAIANRPTTASYAPAVGGSWNPGGRITVLRSGVGDYTVKFAGLGRLVSSIGGDVQVSAVQAKAHCKVGNWGEFPPDLSLIVIVRCFDAAGTFADAPFNVLFLLPSDHLAYALADQPSSPSYTPSAFYSSNPTGGTISITRSSMGSYTISWTGVGSDIFDGGDVQVTAYGFSNAQCKVEGWGSALPIGSALALVRCFTPGTGTPVDSSFTVLFGS
jgi:hypothetical protein